MFIIDFDDTLFDTQKFKQELASSLLSLEIGEKLFWQTYAEARILSDGTFSYSFERHASILEREGFDYKQVLDNLNKVKEKIKFFLFEDAIYFLESLKESKQDLYLLSLGDENFQKLKVEECSISKYFKQVFFRGKDKELVVKEILAENKDTNVFFINDKIEESQKIKNDFQSIEVILKQAVTLTEEKYKKSGLKYFKTLTEIKEYVTNELK
ncbi:MAG: HAD hydrolase-like protein [Patescibacteria group bacterium]|nr:HAD hydrolase-like protein [Patescibacteria group bacterium]